MDFTSWRKDYSGKLTQEEISQDPFEQLTHWISEAKEVVPEANAMVLATSNKDNIPSVRTVLLKQVKQGALFFFTDIWSRKARELLENPNTAVLFPWIEMERQVIVEGKADLLDTEESERYFHSRPRKTQLAAWISHQGEIVTSKTSLEEQFQLAEKRFENQQVPLPEHWGGYALHPTRFEFWQGGANRLHDRFQYLKDGDKWTVSRLAP